MSEDVGGYTLKTEFTTAGGGQSRWAFAERRGKQYFLKEFLKPKYPMEGSPGSDATKAAQRKDCAAFEKHHNAIQAVLGPVSAAGGNLVVATDFFRAGSRYYKVTERVEVTDWAAADVARLPLSSRLLLMLTVAHSLNVLHRAGLVHGDVKPPNILIKRLEEGRFGTKLIDFDNAVLAAKPLPPPDQLVGDMAYYSPELVRYINAPNQRDRLTPRSDIFALGLVYHEWLTGTRPGFDLDARYAGVAVARGERLRVGGMAPPELRDLLVRMVTDPASDRPSADEVHATLRGVRAAVGSDLDAGHHTAAPTAAEPSTLRGTLLKKGGRSKPTGGEGQALRGSLAERKARE
ncbi:MAG TPA: protein kinase [Solirubrobacteraceae bacterium]|nr:protein kinase [Solirubrobacteraceae bacterium]